MIIDTIVAALVAAGLSLAVINGNGPAGYEGQPGNQAGNPSNNNGNGQQGYEGQPGNQGNGLGGYEGQPGNQGGH